MKKVFPLILLAVLIVGGLFVFSQFNKPADETSMQQEEKTKSENEAMTGSIVDFLGKGKNVKCTWDTKDPQKGKGVMYISGKKFFTQSETKDPETTKMVEAFIMSDGEWMYLWGSDKKEGTKMNLIKMQKQTEGMEAEDTETESGKIDYSKISKDLIADNNFQCTSWANFGGVFSVPKEIQFRDLTIDLDKLQESTEKMKEGVGEIKEGMEGLKESACDFCNNLSGDAKTQCLSACQ